MDSVQPIKQIETDSKFESVSDVVNSICKRLSNTAVVDSAVVGAVRSSLSEAINNIIKHAYNEQPDGKIYIKVWLEDNAVHMNIDDNGEPTDAAIFNKESISNPDPESLPEGGWGLYLILSLMDEIKYSTDKKANHLEIVKFYK